MQNQLRVLVIEDSITVQQMVRKMLQPRSGVTFTLQQSDNLTDGLKQLAANEADVVILDLTLPESSGVETVSRVRALDKDIPIVVFTGLEDDNLAVAALHLGADDFLVKSEVRQGSLLARTLIYAVQNKRARIALDRYAVEMERLAASRAQQLLHQDRLATIGTMSAGVAHEIRNPLAYISSNASAMQASWAEVSLMLDHCLALGLGEAEEVEYMKKEIPLMLRDILGGVERIVEIAEGLRHFSRKSAPEPVDICLEELIDNSLLLCHNQLKYGITVEKDFQTDGLRLPLRPQMMLQVFVNLITNAIQAMGGEGVLKIRTAAREDKILVEIEDSGPGIPEEDLDRIFDNFYTTKSDGEGTGLGLSICRKIMEEMGGFLTAENGSDGGALFRLELVRPRVSPPGEQVALAPQLQPA